MARRDPLTVAREQAEVQRLRLEAEVAKRRRAELSRAYEAATTSNYHPRRKERRSADAVMTHASDKLRSIARYLDENHDLAIGVLDDLVNKSVGRGLQCDPMIAKRDGTHHAEINSTARKLWRAWTKARPDATRTLAWGEAQRLIARSLFRDGELLVHHVEGPGAIRHRGPVPYSLELLEADYLPFDRFAGTDGDRVVHGVEKNAWREPVAYHLYRSHPGDLGVLPIMRSADLKRVPATEVTHLKLARRLDQTRGVTIFAGVLTRIEDVKEYDDSERIAARVASAFTAMIVRSPEFQGAVQTEGTRRVLEMAPGMIFDNLLPGESVETIGNNRPGTNYDPYRAANERSIAAGTGTSFSSISRRFDGNYSAQRQELVESDVYYAKLRDYLIETFYSEVYRRFIDLAVLSGALRIDRQVDMSTLYDATWLPPATNWIDPLKEVKAYREEVEAGFISRHEVIRMRGRDPHLVDQQIAADTFTPATTTPAPAAAELLDPTQPGTAEAA